MKASHLVILFIFTIATSCTSYKKVPYLQGAESLSKEDLSVINAKYSQKIMPSDMLSITVNSVTPESAIPFNLPLIPSSSIETKGYGLNSSYGIQSYLVDSEGYIEFPILGKINIGGLSKNEVQDLIKAKIFPTYIKEDPIVTVRFINYKISLLGEVARPGTYSVVNDKINILEALSLSGDMTIYGRRDNVLLMRENEKGEKEIIRIDLSKNDILKSPYFYIQQNDIIYVQPNKSRARGADIGTAETLLISVVGTLISLTGLIVTVLK